MARTGFSRREFLATTAAGTAAMMLPKNVFASSKEQIKVGVIGCGGRGTDACVNALNADPSVVIWAMGDVFQDRVDGSRTHLANTFKDRVQVGDRSFVGWDCHEKVVKAGLDYVILTTPPAFRQFSLRAAVDAGIHIFMEKPVGTDAPSIRAVMKAAEEAKQKKLNIVAGTQRRHDPAYRETIKRIQDGQMGNVVACYAYWNQGGLWSVQKKDGMTDMEWQLRNWLYFTWIAGDIIVEQHIHNQDVCHWVMGKHPIKATSLAGRQCRVDPLYGHVFDHFATEFEYEGGVKMLSMCRQIDGTDSRVHEHIVGSKGTSNASDIIRGENPWRYDKPKVNPYVEEHKHLIEAMKGGAYINEGQQVAESTLAAIMGRMSGYTGKEITWDQALNSQESLLPAKLEFGPIGVPAVAMPGQTAFK